MLLKFFIYFLFLVVDFQLLSATVRNEIGVHYDEIKKFLDHIQLASATKNGRLNSTLQRPSRPVDFEDGTEASVNRHVQDDLFENDIVLTVPQAQHILNEIQADSKNKSRNSRQAYSLSSSYWPTTVPYNFANFDGNWQQLIQTALSSIQSQTCIRFQQSSNSRDYLQFFRGSGCYSSVGRIGGRQQVSIGYGCDVVGIIAHETLHALGLWHEQSRSDRDNYVTILWNNINTGTESNFEKRTAATSENLGQPYDIGSIMHYSSRSFSSSQNQYTIQANDPSYQQTMGQRVGISFKDAKMINMRYCSRICPNDIQCENGGYVNPNQCSVCKCPDGYSGTTCQQVAPSTSTSCRGGAYQATSDLQAITSPAVSARQKCVYRIQAPNNQRVEISIISLSYPCRDVCDSYLEIKYKEDKIATGARLCCSIPNSKIVSENSDVILIQNGIQSGYNGFRVYFRAV